MEHRVARSWGGKNGTALRLPLLSGRESSAGLPIESGAPKDQLEGAAASADLAILRQDGARAWMRS